MTQKNKYNFLYLIFFLSGILYAQNTDNFKKGEVSYISLQNIYIKFDNTEGISVNDTLYFLEQSKIYPCVVVQYLSSSSAAGIKICEDKMSSGKEVFALIKNNIKTESTDSLTVIKDALISQITTDNNAHIDETNLITEVKGKFSISSYSNFSNLSRKSNSQRWRYLFSLNAKNIAGIPLSFNNYITFAYRTDQWSNVKNNIGNAMRIYELSLDYDLTYKSKLTFGRKNNIKISSLGSIDGLQFQTKLGDFETGAVLGSRPNFSDYGYNYKMFEYGIYISRTDTVSSGTIQNTIGGFEQTNNFNTDRRFIYIQHINNSIRNISVFASSEIDLYKRKNGVADNTFSLTSLYLSARYNPSRIISFSASYDARKNIVYYETYKNYADSLLESETRQGLRISTIFRPINYLSIGLNYGYRFKNNDVESTNNYGGYVSYSNIPIIKSSLNISYNNLNTSYLTGSIISLRVYKYLITGLLNTGISYKKVNYDYKTTSYSLIQNIFTLDFSFQLYAKVFLSANFEGTYEGIRSYNRVYLNLTSRF